MQSPVRQAAATGLQGPAVALPRRLALGSLVPRARPGVAAQATPSSATQTVIQRDFSATTSGPSTSGRPAVAEPEPILVRRRRCRPPAARQFAVPRSCCRAKPLIPAPTLDHLPRCTFPLPYPSCRPTR